MIYDTAGKEDIGQLVELRLEYLSEDYGGLDAADAGKLRQELPEYFERSLGRTVLAYTARDGEAIIACALLVIVEKPASPAFITGKTGIVMNVYTKPAYRHQGHARALMAMLMQDAARLGLSVVELKATDAGYRLYEGLGFEESASKYRQMRWIPGRKHGI